jgi:small GTP-binding protein
MKVRNRASVSSEMIFKVIMIGESGTGKSCLLSRYIRDEFQNEYKVTIGSVPLILGVEFASKKVDITSDIKAKLQIWDTAGQESFRSIIKSFYRNASSVLLVYNITE